MSDHELLLRLRVLPLLGSDRHGVELQLHSEQLDFCQLVSIEFEFDRIVGLVKYLLKIFTSSVRQELSAILLKLRL